MKSYSFVERTVAKSLEAFPGIRNFAKSVYHRLNYLYFSEQGFQRSIHPQTKLLTPAEWAGTSPETDELFFGYYDKSPWSADMTKAVFHCIKDDSRVEIRVYDCKRRRCEIVGTSQTWNYQQGSMVQWLPNSENTSIIFNDLIENQLSSRIVSLANRSEKVIPYPIQTVHPNGKEALAINYCRLNDVSEYGYSVIAHNFSSNQPWQEDGIWRVDLQTGKGELIVDLATLIAHQPRPEMEGSKHQINHLVYSPEGGQFIFMHRWTGPQGRFSRLYVADADGTNWRLLLDDRMVSHYSWYSETELLTWSRIKSIGDRYYLMDATSGNWRIIGDDVLTSYGDGHPSYSPDRRWIITDTYPNRARQRQLLLYDTERNKVIELGRFLAPWQFDSYKRCDLHPRWSSNGNMISIDSAHEGKRMTYMIDITDVVEEK